MNNKQNIIINECAAINAAGQGVSESVSGETINIPFEKYTLQNGLEVILSEDHRLPTVSLNLWYHVGPANEKPGRTGFAHLFEHMMFQGSKHVGSEPFKTLESAGGTQINGTTGFDRTNYFETLPSEQLEFGLWFESDRMAFLLENLTHKNLENQRDVVRNERREGENRPYNVVREELFRQLFPVGHPYRGVIIGSHADIESVRLEDVHEFSRQYYVPNNATLVIAGDFVPAEAKELVEKYFGTITAGEKVPPIKIQTPVIASPKKVTVTDQIELPRVDQAWLTAPIFKADNAEAEILGYILGQGKASRLYQTLVREKELAQDVAAHNQSMALGSVFKMVATAKPGVEIELLEQALAEELKKIQQTGPTLEELERAQNSITSGFVFALEQTGGFSGIADRLNTYNHYLGDPDYIKQDYVRYLKVTVEDVQRIANQLTNESCVTVLAVPGPKVLEDVPKTEHPEVDLPVEAQAETGDWRVKPTAKPTGLAASPVPVSFQLENGLTVFLSEQTHIPAVSVSLVTLGGSASAPVDKPGLSNFTNQMLMRGTLHRTQEQISAESDRLAANLFTNSNYDSSAVSLEVLKSKLDPAFDLLADVVKNPVFAEAEVERLRQETLTHFVQLKDNPWGLARQALAASLYGSQHPYGFLEIGTPEFVQSLTRENLSKFHTETYTPQNSALVLVGDLNQDEARQLAEKHFADWKGVNPTETKNHQITEKSENLVIIDKPDTPQTALLIGQIGFERGHSDFAAVELMNTILGGMFTSRININLREVHGYTYGARTDFSYRLNAGPFFISTSVRTDTTAAAVAEIFKEVNKLKQELVTDEELALAKKAYLGSLTSRFQTIGFCNSIFGSLFVYGLPLEEYQKIPAEIEAITAEDIQRAANYLQPENFVVVAVGDSAKFEKELRSR